MTDAGLPLLLLVFLLGLRHGLDPDHIATVDGLTRRAATHGSARRAGLWFSCGHGVVVVLVALGASLLPAWTTPPWLASVGALVAAIYLTLMGLMHLRRAITMDDQRPRRHARLHALGHPALIGTLFALSFDTLSQAAAFARAGHVGWPQAAGLGLAFTLGMIMTDAINGLWIARLLARARPRRVRVVTLAIAVSSLFIAATGWLHLLVPSWMTESGVISITLSAVMTLGITAAYGYARLSQIDIRSGLTGTKTQPHEP
jgi:high-affinity nickel-transport protein